MYKNAETATLEALKMQAIGITVTLHSFLQASDIERIKKQESTIFSEILLDERWEGIAFVALYSMDGTIILHSNPALMGKKIEKITATFNNNAPYYHFVTLGTGERVFVSDSKMIIHKRPYILRVALHTYPAEAVLRTAKMHVMFMIGSAILIISGGLFSIMLLSKVEKMQDKIRELENLSMLSRVLAHEIRNPLGSIKGFAQYLTKKISDASLKEYLNIIVKESIRLERLTDELSQYANPQKFNINEINLKEVLHEISLSFVNQNKEIKFSVAADDIYVKTDADKLKQILNNILQNAVDAVSEAREKKVTITAEKINGKIKIEIADTGAGMDENILNRAIEPFFTTKSKGSGLGLAIVKKLCDFLKIELEIKSKKGEGTKVCLRMPEYQ